jgi:hypothetical protein
LGLHLKFLVVDKFLFYLIKEELVGIIEVGPETLIKDFNDFGQSRFVFLRPLDAGLRDVRTMAASKVVSLWIGAAGIIGFRTQPPHIPQRNGVPVC